MKKYILFFVCMILTFSVFATSKPSYDGRAEVAAYGELPSGLFGKTVGFLPGDTVIVTNPSANISIEVMIFGTIDSSEGIAIVLSPEAAKELYITKGNNAIVQVTKKSNTYSENSILAKTLENYIPDLDPDIRSEYFVENTELNDLFLSTEVPEEILEQVEEEIAKTEENETEIPTGSEDLSEILFDGELSEETENTIPVEEILADETKEIVEETELAEVVEPEETAEVIEETELAEVVEPEETAEVFEETELAEVVEPEETAEVIEETEIEEVVEPAETAEIVEETELAEVVEPAETAEIVEETELAEVVEPAETAEIAETTEIEEDIQVSLIETTENPPVYTSIPIFGEAEVYEDEENIDGLEDEPEVVLFGFDEEPTEDQTVENVDVTMAVSETEQGDESEVITSEVVEPIVEASVKMIENLQKGKYYIQIATYSKTENVTDIFNKYGKNYPIVCLKNSSGSLQVLIGELTADEYAIVLARFKSYGFKDAFLRIGK